MLLLISYPLIQLLDLAAAENFRVYFTANFIIRNLRSDRKDHLITQLIQACLPTGEHVLVSTKPIC